jgi:hypothetical protein
LAGVPVKGGLLEIGAGVAVTAVADGVGKLLFEDPCVVLESCAKAAVDTRNNTTADAIACNFISFS